MGDKGQVSWSKACGQDLRNLALTLTIGSSYMLMKAIPLAREKKKTALSIRNLPQASKGIETLILMPDILGYRHSATIS